MHSTVALHMELALALYGTAEELLKDLLSSELEPQQQTTQSTVVHKIPPASHILQTSGMEAPSVGSGLSSNSSHEIAGNTCSHAVPYADYLEP